uniref:Uncharacterized protein n=1 Tax=Eutreptiella gymnastica TaxID=73025 RepID=A0A7S4FT64_9EUGL
MQNLNCRNSNGYIFPPSSSCGKSEEKHDLTPVPTFPQGGVGGEPGNFGPKDVSIIQHECFSTALIFLTEGGEGWMRGANQDKTLLEPHQEQWGSLQRRAKTKTGAALKLVEARNNRSGVERGHSDDFPGPDIQF